MDIDPSPLSHEGMVMDTWLTIVIRQIFIYALPVMISLSLVQVIEGLWWRKSAPHPFFAITWRTA